MIQRIVRKALWGLFFCFFENFFVPILTSGGQLAAIFALTHKAVQLTNEGLSGSMRKKIERHAKLDEQSNTYMLSAFLIAQFGKNAQYTEKITGNELMDMTMNILVAVQREIGGGVVYLECEERPQLLTFYENEQNRFRVFGERYSDKDQVKYIQLLRLF